MKAAVAKYIEFQGHELTDIQSWPDLHIPATVVHAGTAKDVLYRSDKRNPSTGEDEGWIDYIHEHSKGVGFYRCDGAGIGTETKVPAWIRSVGELVWIGQLLSFQFEDHEGRLVEARGVDNPFPDLYTIPSGKALIVIQGKTKVLAMMWGGKLGVEQRGIVH